MIRIGEKIEEVFKESGMGIGVFANRMQRTTQNCRDIFKRKSIDTDLLIKIGKVLHYDFISYLDLTPIPAPVAPMV